MAALAAEGVLESDGWDQDELSEMKGLLQRAERRMRKLDPAGKHTMKATNSYRLPKLIPGPIAQPYTTSNDGIARADRTRLVNDKDRQITARQVEDLVKVKERIKKELPTAGPGWFDMPRTRLSSELKSDMKLLKLRNVLDPHRHYRSDNIRALAPEFSQIGQIIEGPTEYYSSRLPNKERKRTLVGEILANEKYTGRFKKKYNEIQASKTSGKRAYYKKLKEKRSGGIRKL
ncbi:hypothetical protein HO133_000299 [Letharia lupina]|uniref:Fcf2 pre-rRNA processing C-terminal domain-containing protein n=1 Tax=Letharia lupina TaxID=560253 RepID=A0A8H6CHT9_9LECA|nr:uncharacterized protein HO133_000299 [Letharia lupina]KAF6223456.1 hypothetical protein HO133_000299 [Letharia lupina]